MKYVICIFAFSMFLSCNPISNSDAISTAGENKAGLKSVLKHYSASSSDSMKYRAAKFLIDNMVYHYGISDNYADSAKQIFEAITALANGQSHLSEYEKVMIGDSINKRWNSMGKVIADGNLQLGPCRYLILVALPHRRKRRKDFYL